MDAVQRVAALEAELARAHARIAELEAAARVGASPPTSLLATVLDLIPDLIFMKDRGLRTTLCNASFARALGKSPQGVLGRSDVENDWDPVLVHGDPARGIRGFEQDDRDALAGRAVRNPHDLAHVGGELRVFDTYKLPVRDADGEVIGVLGISRDITDRTRIEEALRRSEAQFRQIIDVSPMPYALCDERQNVIYVNPAFVRAYGYELADVPTLADWWPRAYPDPEYREWVATTWLGRLDQARRERTSDVEPLEVTICCKDGARRTALVSAASLGADFDGVYLVILYDITERSRAEEQRRALEERAQHAQKLESLGILAGGIAHDFNNMLQAILGNAELALLGLRAAPDARAAIEEVVRTAQSCAGLTTQMLAYSGKGRFVVEDVDLSRLIADMRSLLCSSVPKKAELELDLRPGRRRTSADASQLGQVVLNLVINAGEAIGDRPGRVRVSVDEARCEPDCPCRALFPQGADWPARDVVTLRVSDTGCGMDATTRARIFDPFFSTKFTGRGLGLAAVHGILRGHQAGLLVESLPGQGTSFTVHFAALDRPADAPRGALAAPTPLRGQGTVLLADDEDAIRRLVRTTLEAHGFTVVTAGDGEQALALFRQRRDEVVCAILDVSMPRLSGVEARAALRRLAPALPVLLTSGYGEEALGREYAHDPACAFLQKPYALGALLKKLGALLGG